MSTPPCLVHGVGADEPCSLIEPICPARFARMCNPLVSMFRAMSNVAVDAAERAREATRGEPGTAPPIVVDEDVAARAKGRPS